MFENIPKNWKKYKLKDLYYILRGGSPRPIDKYLTSDPNGINWIKIGDAKVGSKFIESTKEKIIPEGKNKSRFVNVGDFILSNSMSFGRPYIMKTEGCIHDGWLVLKEKEKNIIYKDFVYYLLCSKQVHSQFENAAAGGVVSNLNIQRVENVEVVIPNDIREQKEIADVLDAASEIIRLRTACIESAQSLIPALFQEMFGDPINNNKNWTIVKIDTVTNVISGGTPSTKILEYWDGDIVWLTPKDLSGYNSVYIAKGERNITDLGHKKSSAQIMPKGSVLFTSRAPIGYVAIAETDLCTNQGFKSFVPSKDIKSEYLYQLLKIMKPKIINMASGTVFKEISGSKIKELKIPLPDIELQNQFAAKVREIDAYIKSQQAELENAKNMFQSLLYYAFTGKLTKNITFEVKNE